MLKIKKKLKLKEITFMHMTLLILLNIVIPELIIVKIKEKNS